MNKKIVTLSILWAVEILCITIVIFLGYLGLHFGKQMDYWPIAGQLSLLVLDAVAMVGTFLTPAFIMEQRG
jgi:hypothetical protein